MTSNQGMVDTYDLVLDLIVQLRQLRPHRRNVALLEGDRRFLIFEGSANLHPTRNV